MSLDWNLTEIHNYREVCWLEEGKLNPVTNVIIMATMSVGIGHITDKNVDEFAACYRIFERLNGPFLRRNGEDYSLTDEEIHAHIGLSTNVPNEARAAWARRLFVNQQTSITADYARDFRRATAERLEKVANG
jgi:hypothetical protein